MQNEIESTLGELPHNVKQTLLNFKNLEKLKILFWVETFGDHLWLVILLSVILDGNHYQISQKGLPSLTEST